MIMDKKFHERFNIRVGQDEAKRRFVNRAYNLMESGDLHYIVKVREAVANALGERHFATRAVDQHIKGDFLDCLLALEGVFEDLKGTHAQLDGMIHKLVTESESDLGIRWQNGKFLLSSAGILDEALVNDSLKWLSDPKYANVYAPFEKALSHFMKSVKHPELLFDVITDMYESLEGLAKILTNRPGRDLSGNREVFLKNIKASEGYKKILRDYIDYANDFRHAVEEGRVRPSLSRQEAESFIYLTGIFIRLAMSEK
jgi:hypothetical protein